MGDPKTCIVTGDWHAPWVDMAVFSALLADIKAIKPNIIVLNGDILDCYAVGRYRKDPTRHARLVDEIAGVAELLRSLRQAAGAARIVYLGGNHEERLQKYIYDHAPGLDGAVKSLPELLGLPELRIEWRPYKSDFRFGDALIAHDYDYSSRIAARKSADVLWSSVAIGHCHYLGCEYRGDGRWSASSGWLGRPEAATYANSRKQLAQWAHGYLLVRASKRGLTRCLPVQIQGGYSTLDLVRR